MKTKSQLSELRESLWSFKPEWRWIFGLSLLIGLLGLTSTVYMFEVYGRVVNSGNIRTLVVLTVVAFGAYAFMEVLDKVRAHMLWSLGVRFEIRWAERIYHAMVDGLMGRHKESAQLVETDLRTVREFFSNYAVTGLLETPIGLVCVGLLFLINPFLGWAAILGVALQTCVAWALQSTTREPISQAQQQMSLAQAYADASLRNTEVMESMGMLPAVLKQWRKRQQQGIQTQTKASLSAAGLNAASKLLQQMMGSVLLGLSALFLLQDKLNGGSAMLIVGSVLAGRLLSPLAQVIQQWSAIMNAAAAWVRLEQTLMSVPPRPKAMPLPVPKGHLQVQALTGSAPGREQAFLLGIDFDVKPGQVIGIIGPSASGKSSLARLLVGVWLPRSGKVRLDGADLHQWNKEELGPHVGYLPQTVELMEGTVAENIARFGELDMPRIQEAVHLAGLTDLIASLPKGYDTPIGSDGHMLSGGQRQRVGLARALYGRPVLIVLDEPNSNLDEAGDAALLNAIRVLKATGSTFVVITHKTNLLPVTDQLLVLVQGRQQICGSTAEVMAKLSPAPQVAQAQANTSTPQQHGAH